MMVDLSTKYMGLNLHNPVVVSSCSLTNSVEGVCRCADAGAGAVVLKSLFEEQIRVETEDLEKYLWFSGHPEALDYVRNMSMELGPREYIDLVRESKSAVSIPVIASLNCVSAEWWADYAIQLEAVGADALELNIAIMPSDPKRSSDEIERLYFRVLEEVKKRIDIPIAVKIDPYFTCTARVADEFGKRGASALVLFNRLYQFDINIDKLELASGYRFSSPEEMNTSLRWIALLAGRVKCDLAASTGVHDGVGVIKQLLAGASVAQICSTLYLNGLEQIDRILGYLENWMEEHNFDSVDQMRGKMSQMQSDRPELYDRLQYVKALVGIG
jgi:dihydroorotate dehydrogenase (fumarate)